jgi:hypothetical protein
MPSFAPAPMRRDIIQNTQKSKSLLHYIQHNPEKVTEEYFKNGADNLS